VRPGAVIRRCSGQGSRSNAVLPMDVLVLHREDVVLPCPPAGLSELCTPAEVLDRVPDPHRVRGRRYRNGVLLTLCLVAALSGATSLACIALLHQQRPGPAPTSRARSPWSRAARRACPSILGTARGSSPKKQREACPRGRSALRPGSQLAAHEQNLVERGDRRETFRYSC
jgi:hypothetical protein